ncbi:uncharacterized protein LOC119796614 [Cyprinodon tularosa]|uniref:uncharacterized protein LOC119796614 n=1 Tax=Cyprinodon tularosa TaxID=77115 RepID=UPI0018E20179|nr:uncharacterized protein LOC119796614 [Cyprinodon tularosa]
MGNMNRSTCGINMDWYHSGVYWCESGSEHFSNAVNITVQEDINGIILVSPVHPVTEGDPVTLSCRDKEQKLLSNVFFYHNNKLIHNDGREDLNISTVSKSDEGFYKCEHSGKKSPQSWMAVRVPLTSPVSSSLPVLLIVGAVIGLILIILLMLLWCCRRSKGLSCISLNQSEGSNETSATNPGVTQTDGPIYSSLLHEDLSIYETIQPLRASGHVPAERPHLPAKDSDYPKVKPDNYS